MGTGEPRETPDLGKVLDDAIYLIRRAPRSLSVGLALVIIGLLGRAAGGSFLFSLLTGIGLLLLFAWVAGRYGLLRKDEVVEQWNFLIGSGDGRVEEVFGDIHRLISESRAPDIGLERRDITPGIIRGVLGGRRDFLLVFNNINPNLNPFRMYINARDYGKNLQVSWYVVHQPGFWRRLMVLLLFIPFINLLVFPVYFVVRLTRAREAGILDLDLFDLQDLYAYVANAHHCVLGAVEKLMVDLHQDPSTMDRESRGFLGIS